MIATCYYEFHVRHLQGQQIERLNHQFQTLVRPPFSESQNALDRSSTAREVRQFRAASQQSVRAKMDIVPPVFIVQDLAISGHEDRDGVGEQQHPRRHRARESIEALVTDASILEFDSIHEVVQSHVGISSSQAREQRRHESAESHKRVSAKSAEQQIEPNDIWFQSTDRSDQPIEG